MAAQAVETTKESASAATRTDSGRPDLPFYNGLPRRIEPIGWAAILSACVLAVVQLMWLPVPAGVLGAQWIPMLMFPVLPLLALAWAAPGGWTALFRRIRVRDVFAMIGFAALNLAVVTPLALALHPLIGAEANPAVSALTDMSVLERVQFFAASIPQLIGEELVTILPMLALMAYLTHLGWKRRPVLAIAWIASALLFAALHLPTYGWNVLQCLVLIGVARLVLTLAYVVTRNLGVSAGAHIVNDWVTFAAPLLIGGAALVA